MSVAKEIKQAVIMAANACCHYCSGHATTVDHKVSLFAGGTDARNNPALWSKCHKLLMQA